MQKLKRFLIILIVLVATVMSLPATTFSAMGNTCPALTAESQILAAEDFIKWIDINVPMELIEKIIKHTNDLKDTQTPLDFFEALSYVSTKNANNFSFERDTKTLNELVKRVKAYETISSIYGENKYYNYYLESYKAVFGGMVGYYKDNSSNETKFGITGYFPFAKGYWYNHYDDFGNSRSYGFKRKHLGHDLQGSVGTPIIAVEGGTVTEYGWNRYGGWRIGIRSKDTKRYYYYAHLRKDRPYPAHIKLGDTIKAGEVIGYLGNTGYSTKENVNMKSCKPHLHFGLQIIFDKSQEKGSKEIWVDVYQICRMLSKNRVKVSKNEETKEYFSLV